MQYRVSEDLLEEHRRFERRNAKLMQMMGRGRGSITNALPHVTGKGYYAYKYLGDGEVEWLDDYTDYEVTMRRNATASVCLVNTIDLYLQENLFAGIRDRLRVELVEGKRYFVDAEFRLWLRNNEVDEFETVGIVTVSSFDE